MKRKFCERLKELRSELELSYSKLEQETGLSRSSLCNWETGVSDITSDSLIVLARFFKVSIDYLLGLED